MKLIVHNICYFILFVIAFIPIVLDAQSMKFHQYNLRVSMGMSQTAVDDWKQGEVVAFDWNAASDYRNSFSLDLSDNWNYDSLVYRFRFYFATGVLYKKDKKNSYEYFIPTDNIFGSEAVMSYPLGWKLDPFFSASFFTQIVPSFSIVNKERQMTAKYWDPVTAQQTWGFEYSVTDSNKQINSRFGISLKQIRAHDHTQLTDDRKTLDIKERWKPDSGIQWKSEAKFHLVDNCDYKAILDVFTTFDDMTKCVVTMQNEFKISIWGYLAILFKFDIVYDEKISTKTQYNQSIRFGIVVDRTR